MNPLPPDQPEGDHASDSVDGNVKDMATDVLQGSLRGLGKYVLGLVVLASTGTIITKGCFAEHAGPTASQAGASINAQGGVNIPGTNTNSPISVVYNNNDAASGPFNGPGSIAGEKGAVGRWISKSGGELFIAAAGGNGYTIKGSFGDPKSQIPEQPFQMEMRGNHGHSLLKTENSEASIVFLNPGNANVKLKGGASELFDRDEFYHP